MWDQSATYWIILVAANIPVFVGAGWLCFGSWGEFWESLRFYLTPDIISAVRGELGDDWVAELKLAFFVGGCAALVLLEHVALHKLGWA